MDKQDLIRRVESIHDLKKDYKELYSIMDELGIQYKKTTCMKCRRDYLNIVKEELGMIESAAENSDFNTTTDGGWKYLKDRTYVWTRIDGTRVKINEQTPVKYIEEFVKDHKGYYVKINK